MRFRFLPVLIALNGFLCHWAPAGFAAEPEAALDERQLAIIAEVTDKVIAEITALKPKHPELAHFGEAPWFTRDAGEFRYEYKSQPTTGGNPFHRVEAQPGGCVMYFRLHAQGGAKSKWSDYYSGSSCTLGSSAGIGGEFVMDSGPDPMTVSNVGRAVFSVVQEGGALLDERGAEYLLTNKNHKTDNASLIAALEDSDAKVKRAAMTILYRRELTADEVAAIDRSFQQADHPLEVAWLDIGFATTHDNAHLPEVYRRFVELALSREKEGKDTFFNDPRAGAAGNLRDMILSNIQQTGGARFSDAESLVLNEDPVTDFRLRALDYFAKLPGAAGTTVLIGALQNSHRSVQVKAAQIVGERKLAEGRNGLLQLLGSPSANVRKNAKAALGKCGISLPKKTPARTLPESMTAIAKTMWLNGLEEKDVIDVCAQPETPLRFPASEPQPDQSQFPPGVVLKDAMWQNTQTDGTGTKVTKGHQWSAVLDAWRMTKMDRDSVRKRAVQFTAGFGHAWELPADADPTGPFLLAAALKLNDTKTAQLVYERLTDQFETDEGITNWCMTGMGWRKFQEAIHCFQRRKDAEALPFFQGVVALEKYAKPSSLLAATVEESKKIIAQIETRIKEPAVTEPDAADRDAWLRYWIGRIKEINALRMDGSDGDETIWGGTSWDDDRTAPQPHVFASDKLRATGLEALPYLMEVMDDRTITRTVYCSDSGRPQFGVSTVGGLARQVFVLICCDYGLAPPDFLKNSYPSNIQPAVDHATKMKLYKEWLPAVPAGASPLPKEARLEFRNKHFANVWGWND